MVQPVLRRARACALVFVAFVTLLGASPTQAARPIAETDLFDFVWIADPQISPDGSRVVFVRVTVNDKKDGYDTSLWVVETSGASAPRRLTSGTRDTAPRWSPDGAWLACVRPVDARGRTSPQIHLLSMAGGEATAITDLPRGAGAAVWAPDGKTIAFLSTTKPDDLTEKKDPAERVSDVRVITRAVYRDNGGGYRDYTRANKIWTVPVPAGAPAVQKATRLTSGDFGESGLTWTRDSQRILFTTTLDKEPYYKPQDSDLYAIPAGGGTPALVASIDGGIGNVVVSPDGGRVAFVASPSTPVRSYTQPDLWVAPLDGSSAPRNLTTAYDFDMGTGLAGDQGAPRGGRAAAPTWTPDGRAIVYGTEREGRVNLVRVDAASGAVTSVTTGDHEVMSWTADAKVTQFATLISTPTNVGDLFLVPATGGTPRRLTDVNKDLFAQITLTAPDDLWVTSFDGRKVHTLVQRPPNFDASKKYPVILNIHGGPHSAYGYTFFHEMQWMAAQGYVVVYPNPRGSTSYGQDFGNIIQHKYPGDDGKDLLAAVDAVITRGWGDPDRLGVTGGSGGGVLTNYLVTQTNRFKAAVSQRSISDWEAFWFTADFVLFQPSWFKAAPWEDPKDFAERSAVTHIAKITTPIMFVEGADDLRTPPSAGGEQLFRGLKYLKRPTVMVQFPGESHELSRSGHPWHRVERLRHIVGWMDKWILGKDVKGYEP